MTLAASLLSSPATRAQQPPAETYSLKVDVQLVNVDVAVTDPKGNFIRHLQPENFRLLEDGVPQTLAHFAPARAPVRIALLVEASPAVYLIRGEHLATAHLLLAGLRPEDEAALLTYARDTHLEVNFTRDKQQVERRLQSLQQFGLGVAEMNLLYAVARTLEWLSPPPRRTAVLIIGTGLDTRSRVSWAELERQIGAGQITFFAIATGNLLRGEPDEDSQKKAREANDAYFRSAFAEADARLKALAAASAGQAYFPESVEDVDDIYREIAERLRNLYSLGYYPTKRARDGAYREITVKLVADDGKPLTVRDSEGNRVEPRVFARPGYFAPRE